MDPLDLFFRKQIDHGRSVRIIVKIHIFISKPGKINYFIFRSRTGYPCSLIITKIYLFIPSCSVQFRMSCWYEWMRSSVVLIADIEYGFTLHSSTSDPVSSTKSVLLSVILVPVRKSTTRKP